MVKKKVSKKTAKVKSVRKIKSSKNLNNSEVIHYQRKTGVAVWNLCLFAVLSIISYILSNISGTDFYRELFYLASLLFGVVALTFLIVFLVFLLLNWMRK